jgi:hypothetical protein
MSSPPVAATRRAAISAWTRSVAACLLRANFAHGGQRAEVGLQEADEDAGRPDRVGGGEQGALEGGDALGVLHAEHGLDDDVERDGLGGVLHDERLAERPGAGALEGAVVDDPRVRTHAGAVQRRGQEAALAGVALAVDEDERALAEQRGEVAGVEAGDRLVVGAEDLLDVLGLAGEDDALPGEPGFERVAEAAPGLVQVGVRVDPEAEGGDEAVVGAGDVAEHRSASYRRQGRVYARSAGCDEL